MASSTFAPDVTDAYEQQRAVLPPLLTTEPQGDEPHYPKLDAVTLAGPAVIGVVVGFALESDSTAKQDFAHLSQENVPPPTAQAMKSDSSWGNETLAALGTGAAVGAGVGAAAGVTESRGPPPSLPHSPGRQDLAHSGEPQQSLHEHAETSETKHCHHHHQHARDESPSRSYVSSAPEDLPSRSYAPPTSPTPQSHPVEHSPHLKIATRRDSVGHKRLHKDSLGRTRSASIGSESPNSGSPVGGNGREKGPRGEGEGIWNHSVAQVSASGLVRVEELIRGAAGGKRRDGSEGTPTRARHYRFGGQARPHHGPHGRYPRSVPPLLFLPSLIPSQTPSTRRPTPNNNPATPRSPPATPPRPPDTRPSPPRATSSLPLRHPRPSFASSPRTVGALRSPGGVETMGVDRVGSMRGARRRGSLRRYLGIRRGRVSSWCVCSAGIPVVQLSFFSRSLGSSIRHASFQFVYVSSCSVSRARLPTSKSNSFSSSPPPFSAFHLCSSLETASAPSVPSPTTSGPVYAAFRLQKR